MPLRFYVKSILSIVCWTQNKTFWECSRNSTSVWIETLSKNARPINFPCGLRPFLLTKMNGIMSDNYMVHFGIMRKIENRIHKFWLRKEWMFGWICSFSCFRHSDSNLSWPFLKLILKLQFWPNLKLAKQNCKRPLTICLR